MHQHDYFPVKHKLKVGLEASRKLIKLILFIVHLLAFFFFQFHLKLGKMSIKLLYSWDYFFTPIRQKLYV